MPIVDQEGELGTWFQNRLYTELQRERKTDEFTTPDISLSLSLSPRKLSDSAEEAGTIVAARDCLSKGSIKTFLRWDSHFRKCEPDGSGSGGV